MVTHGAAHILAPVLTNIRSAAAAHPGGPLKPCSGLSLLLSVVARTLICMAAPPCHNLLILIHADFDTQRLLTHMFSLLTNAHPQAEYDNALAWPQRVAVGTAFPLLQLAAAILSLTATVAAG